jgi:hypothetical protein
MDIRLSPATTRVEVGRESDQAAGAGAEVVDPVCGMRLTGSRRGGERAPRRHHLLLRLRGCHRQFQAAQARVLLMLLAHGF